MCFCFSSIHQESPIGLFNLFSKIFYQIELLLKKYFSRAFLMKTLFHGPSVINGGHKVIVLFKIGPVTYKI